MIPTWEISRFVSEFSSYTQTCPTASYTFREWYLSSFKVENQRLQRPSHGAPPACRKWASHSAPTLPSPLSSFLPLNPPVLIKGPYFHLVLVCDPQPPCRALGSELRWQPR